MPPPSPLSKLLNDLRQAPKHGDIARLAEEALQHLSREDNPELWANLHGTLGSALVAAAGGRYTNELFSRVLAAYQAALEVYTPEQTPGIWGQTWRNVGATYVGAVQSGLGDPQPLLEAAIAAYHTALELPLERHYPQVWLDSQRELGWALGVAAAWRGPSAHLESAEAYAAALRHVSRETAAESWAKFQLLRGSALNESGASDVGEQAIEACENAVEVLSIDTRPADWAEAHLILGGLYRTRRAGQREENLERSVIFLNRALEVFTRDHTPDQWFRVHYHRGPAYVFRVHGDRGTNLEQALESLHIVIPAIPREHAPDTWGSLHVTLGQAYMERVHGEHADNLEAAISSFEAAVAVLPRGSLAWKTSQRLLGLGYLQRKCGDRDENAERAVTALAAGKGPREPSEDPRSWSGAHANLGEAYLRRARGDAAENRAHAREAFAAAVSEPPEHWPGAANWFAVLRRLALLDVDFPLSLAGVELAAAPKRPAPATAPDASDLFGLAQQAREQAGALQTSIESGEEPEVDAQWHAPQLFNEEVALLRQHFREFLSGADAPPWTLEQRSRLELRRWELFMQVLEHLHEKYDAASRTQALFHEVARGGQGFVLFLRGFAWRPQYYSGVTIVHGSGPSMEEVIQKRRLAQQLAPIPLVLIGNPVESGPLELVMDQMLQGEDGRAAADPAQTAPIFRVESGATWEADVSVLIRASSFVVMYNPVMTPGVLTELSLLRQLGRLDDTFCHCAEAANDVLGLKNGCRPLNDAAVEHMREATRPRPLAGLTLPAVTIRWVEGPRRAQLEREMDGLSRWAERLAQHTSPPAAHLHLDVTAYLIGTLVLLEDLERLPGMLLARAATLATFDAQRLPQAKVLADCHAQAGNQLLRGWAQASGEDSVIARIAAALRLI